MNLYWGGRNGVANAKPVHPANPADPAYDWSIYDQSSSRSPRPACRSSSRSTARRAGRTTARGRTSRPATRPTLRELRATRPRQRYSGKFVRDGVKLPRGRSDWLAWNEPNNPVFLSPQYRAGRHALGDGERDRLRQDLQRGLQRRPRDAARGRAGRLRRDRAARQQRPVEQPAVGLAARVPARGQDATGSKTFDAWAHHPYYAKPVGDAEPTRRRSAGESVELGNIGT